jgi:hypothetical protein
VVDDRGLGGIAGLGERDQSPTVGSAGGGTVWRRRPLGCAGRDAQAGVTTSSRAPRSDSTRAGTRSGRSSEENASENEDR